MTNWWPAVWRMRSTSWSSGSGRHGVPRRPWPRHCAPGRAAPARQRVAARGRRIDAVFTAALADHTGGPVAAVRRYAVDASVV